MFAYVIKTNGTKYKAQPYGYPSSAQYKKWREQKTRALNNRKRGKAKGTQKIQKHTYLKTDGHTFLTFCPIFGISRISKIRHLVSSRGNTTKKKTDTTFLKKNLQKYSPRPFPPVHRLLHPHPNYQQIDDCTNDDSRPERIHHQQFFNDRR